MSQTKPKILYLVHAYHRGAGTEQHVNFLVSGLSTTYETYVVVPNQGKLYLLANDKVVLEFDCVEAGFPITPIELPQMQEKLKKIVDHVKPHIIHVQHIVRWPLNILSALSQYGAKLVMSFHDYYAFTPLFTMEGIEHASETLTSAYSLRMFGNDISEYLKSRRRIIDQGLKCVNKLIVPSQYLANKLQAEFPYDFQVIEHGIPQFSVIKQANKSKLPRFAYVGNLLPQKGYEIALQAMRVLREKYPDFSMKFFGGVQKLEAEPGLEYEGYYERSELPRIMGQIDVGIIPSKFAEPYCMVLSEFWLSGIPVIASDIGALADRVVDGQNGLKFRTADVNDLVAKISWFIENDSWKTWKISRPRLVDEMLVEYDKFYRALI